MRHFSGHKVTKRALPSLSFEQRFAALFHANIERLTRVLCRISGDPDLAADVVQGAFVRLHERGSMPDSPEAWVVTAALNLFRNARSTERRRERLLTLSGGANSDAAPNPSPSDTLLAREARDQVRAALDRLPERERNLLLLRAEGYSYRELSSALDLNEGSVGTLLARAKEAFREAYAGDRHAS